MKFLFTLLFIVLSLSLYAEPIINVNQPIKKLKLTSLELENAIVNAATTQRWNTDSTKNSTIVATYKKSNYMAKIIIKYEPTFYSIHYLDSKKMRYKDSNIHPTYNKLIKKLQKNIVVNLKTGNYSSKEETPQSQLQSKLITLKNLYDSSLITQKEYDSKRKMLIDAY